MGLSKAFDRIGRNTLWWILYRKGLPLPFINILIQGHTDTLLCSRRKGIHGPYIGNNIGVFQCSPISPQLFTIYADFVMKDFDKNIKNTNTTRNNIITIDKSDEDKWTSHLIDQFAKQQSIDKPDKAHINLANTNSVIKSNYTLFADDAAIDINLINGLEPIIKTYNNSTNKYQLIIQRIEVEILTKGKFIKNSQNHIKTLPDPKNFRQSTLNV